MGNVTFGVPEKAALALRDAYGIETFIETGTFKGGTARWAAAQFERVYTIEADRERYAKTLAAMSGNCPENIEFIQGDSRVELGNVLDHVQMPALIWLDAHWNGGGAKEAHEIGDECPLREELAAILTRTTAHNMMKPFILIDDARLFLNPPPYPHDPAQWMTYGKIEAALLTAGYRVGVKDDVIYALPTDEAMKLVGVR